VLAVCALSLGFPADEHAQQLTNGFATNQPSTAYVEVSRGPHSRVMQRAVTFTNAAGAVVTRTNSYTELATGLSHVVGNQYVPSSDEIWITANGAAGTNCQHQSLFNSDFGSSSVIDLVTPEGFHMTSGITALVYFDGVTNVVIATPQDSIGQLLPSLNQIIYTNAFTNISCDVIYTHTLAGFSQDVVVRQALPSPASFGLTGSNIWLQVWTEFSSCPTPNISEQGDGDEYLNFGEMRMAKGRAVMVGTNAPSAHIFKQWYTDSQSGRKFLIESVLLDAIEPQLKQLPGGGSSGSGSGGGQSRLSRPHPMMAANGPPRQRSKPMNLPARKLAKKNGATMRLAKSALVQKGLVLDYDILNGSLSGHVFPSDGTTFITNVVNISGTATFERGTVVKYAANANATIIASNAVWNTSSYGSASFTGMDDDTVGDQISGSSGNPATNYYGFIALNLEDATSPVISNARFSFLSAAIAANNVSLRDVQVNQCQTLMAGDSQGYDLGLFFNMYNVLACNVGDFIGWEGNDEGQTIICENVTVHHCNNFLEDPTSYLGLTNCLFVCVTNMYISSGYNETNHCAILSSDSGIFQIGGAGAHYLVTNTFQGLGTTNIDPALLAELGQKTTYPPLWLTNTITTNTVLGPRAQRENAAAPDYGYAYDPIDWVAACSVSNATLTLTNGVALAYYSNPGILLQNASQLVSQGSPIQPNCLVYYTMVQEQSTNLWRGVSSSEAVQEALAISPQADVATAPVASLDFTSMDIQAGAAQIWYGDGDWAMSSISLKNCEIYAGGGWWTAFASPHNPAFLFQNNLFHRARFDIEGAAQISLYNNLFFGDTNGGGGAPYFIGFISAPGTNRNNAFDGCVVSLASTNIGWNAYLNGATWYTLKSNDVVTNITWVAGPLGHYYQPTTNSPLINKGNTNADLLGLYYYTTTTNEVEETNSIVDISYHYVALDNTGQPNDTLWTGIPDYLADTNGALATWQTKYFGHIGIDPNGDYDGDGTNNLQEYLNGTDPNKIQFSLSLSNQYVDTNMVPITIVILGGVPSNIAVLVDSTNFSGATWSSYTSSNITVNITTNQGAHDVWVGLRGLPSDAHQTWVETTLVLDSTAPAITITSPTNNVTFNASRVDVSGHFVSAGVQQITVNGILAFVNGTNFEALNVPLADGSNLVTAVLADLTGDTNTASINVNATTNVDGSLNDPVELAASPVAGFYPLAVTFQVTTNLPGTVSNVFYDFNGDDIADFTTNNFSSLTYTYSTNGQFFPVVTVQSSLGRFSSPGGWNTSSLDPGNQVLRINVLASPVLVTNFTVTDPVDIKWTATSNLYVLSGSTATITEYNSSWTSIRSLSGIGSSPSGLDVDTTGKVYVAMTGSNQVWRYYPTNSTFAVDTNFGTNGCIGNTSGASGTNSGQFSAPYDVAVSPDGGTISVSDSGNNRVQQFDINGNFLTSFGGAGTNIGQFSSPAGLSYDGLGTLYVADSGNNRIAVVNSSEIVGVSGTAGTGLLQFSDPLNVSVGERGIYVADSSNNRIQALELLANGVYTLGASDVRYAFSGGFSGPAAAATAENLTNELVYVADTGNNKVLLYRVPLDDPTPVWSNMVSHATSGDLSGSVASFSIESAQEYLQAFLSVGAEQTLSDMNDIGTLTPVFIKSDTAEYYFEQTINGQLTLFPVEFVKENGAWKILEY
jgi:hypothetical protein